MAMEWFKALVDRANGVLSATAAHAHNIVDDTPGSLTAEKDANGKSVLRVLLAAVFGYDNTNDLWKGSLVRREHVPIQTHNAISVGAATGVANSTVIDCRGMDSISVGMKNDAATARAIAIFWYAEQAMTNLIGGEVLVASAADSKGIGRIQIKADWAMIQLQNTDAAIHVMSTWTTLIP